MFIRAMVLTMCAGALMVPRAEATVAGAPIQPGDTLSTQVSGSDTGCADPNDNGPFSGSGVLSVSSVVASGSDFVVSAVLNLSDGEGTGSIDFVSVLVDSAGNFSAIGLPLNTSGPPPGTGQVQLEGIMTSAGIDATGSFAENPPDTCSGPLTVTGTGQGTVGAFSASTEVVTNSEQQRANLNTAQTIAQVARARLGARRMRFAPGSPSAFQVRPAGEGGLRFDAQTGLAAGEEVYGAWASATYGGSQDEFAASAFDATRWSVLGGIDRGFGDTLIAGVAFGVDHSDIDTVFNGGNAEVTGLTVAPYLGATLSDSVSIDAALGYSYTRTDQFRIAPGTGARVASDTTGDRWFATANANWTHGYGQWLLTGTVGLLYARNKNDGFTEINGLSVSSTSSKLGQARIGAELAYGHGAWEPYARALYEHDYSKTELNVVGGRRSDDNGGQFGLGLRYFGSQGISGLLEYSSVFGRDDFSDDSVSATVRWEW